MDPKIKFIQRVLNTSGVNTGKPDGIAGPKTMAGIDSFLAANNVNTDRWTTARKVIAALQVIINLEGKGPGLLAVDGYYGHNTDYAWQATEYYLRTGKGMPRFRRDDESGFDTSPRPGLGIDWPKGDIASLIERFGDPRSADFITKHLVMVDISYPLKLSWNTSQHTQKITCHRELALAVPAIFNEILDAYGREQVEALGLDIFGGCYNMRLKRGGTELSTHAFAIAIDKDPDRNGLRTRWRDCQFSKPAYKKYMEIWYDYGFINLGKELDFDGMHFQATR